MATKKTGQKTASQLQQIVDRLIQPKALKDNALESYEAKFLIMSVKKAWKQKPQVLLRINSPVVICGDTHGQYRDVLRMFDLNGWPPKTPYLFLGDYVDRGRRSIEVICLMFAMKLTFPNQFFVLRGNHEAKEINRAYGFYTEVVGRYSVEIYNEFNEAFTWMPLAALVDTALFCMHGGIPAQPLGPNFCELEKIQLPVVSPKDNEIVCDLLWSDPSEEVDTFVKSNRGMGHQFGLKQVAEFCEYHGLTAIIRAHQVFAEGYKFFGQQLVTVFSAPNYGGEFDNNASCVHATPTGEGGTTMRITCLMPFHRKTK